MFAYAALLGFDVETMISGSRLARRVREEMVERALELKEQFDEDLALKIINRLAESLDKGR